MPYCGIFRFAGIFALSPPKRLRRSGCISPFDSPGAHRHDSNRTNSRRPERGRARVRFPWRRTSPIERATSPPASTSVGGRLRQAADRASPGRPPKKRFFASDLGRTADAQSVPKEDRAAGQPAQDRHFRQEAPDPQPNPARLPKNSLWEACLRKAGRQSPKKKETPNRERPVPAVRACRPMQRGA